MKGRETRNKGVNANIRDEKEQLRLLVLPGYIRSQQVLWKPGNTNKGGKTPG